MPTLITSLMQAICRRSALLTLSASLALGACRGEAGGAPGLPTPAPVTLEQFQGLRWLQGNWRGAEAGDQPFFESYLFLDDSTIRSFTYTDSTFRQAGDSGVVTWRGGVARVLGGPASWVATRFDSSGVHFEPEHGAGNSFDWILGDHDHWTASLTWPGSGNPPRIRTYQMTRIGS